jgi:hypothetical protein
MLLASGCDEAAHLLDLPLEVLTAVCQYLDLQDLVRTAETCQRFRHGDVPRETVELPNKSPAELVPSMRPIGGSESWVAYLARCTRQRRCRDEPPVEATMRRNLLWI